MRRGEVYWFEPDPVSGHEQSGRRPAIVVSRDAVNRNSPVIIVVPLTTHRGQSLYPGDVLLKAPDGGVTRDSVAMTLHIRAIDKRRIGKPLGRLATPTMHEVEQAILRVLDIQLFHGAISE